MMNCLSARSALLADPAARDAALVAHLASCPSCRSFASTISHDDAFLRRAIDVPVPGQLQERILLQAQLQHKLSCPIERLRTWAAAIPAAYRACLAVAAPVLVALTVWINHTPPDDGLNWAQVALAHAIAEPRAASSTSLVPPAELAEALAKYGLALAGDVGQIRYLAPCPVPGGRGTHIVIETRELGRVTLLLPAVGQRTAAGTASGEGLGAEMIDVVGVGVGVVTAEPHRLRALSILLSEHLVARVKV